MSDQRPPKPREAQAEHIQAESQPPSSPCPPPVPTSPQRTSPERPGETVPVGDLARAHGGWAGLGAGDEVWEVSEENTQGEGRVWRRTWGLEHMKQAMWVTQTEPRQGGPGACIPLGGSHRSLATGVPHAPQCVEPLLRLCLAARSGWRVLGREEEGERQSMTIRPDHNQLGTVARMGGGREGRRPVWA